VKKTTTDSPKTNAKKPPTMVVSEFCRNGTVNLLFSDLMQFSSFFNETNSTDERGRRSSSGGKSPGYKGSAQALLEANTTNSTFFDRNKYTLSKKHLNITL
jgi:hypothetical protein